MPPLVPGFTITGELSSNVTGSTWSSVRTLDDHPFALRIVPVADVTQAQERATREMAVLARIGNEHLVRQHRAIALADGTLALVLDQAIGGGLAALVGSRGQLRPGETVTTVAPLFGALADLHAAAVVHGCLSPASVLFSADGRPMICDLAVARLLGAVAGITGFVAPERVGGAAPSPASDVYAMAAIGWFCLTGAPPAPAAARPSLTSLRPDTPARLVEVLTSCLSLDPIARPSARAAAAVVFHASPAESVTLASGSDPAAEITRRIRAAAVSAPVLAGPSLWERYRRSLAMGAAAIFVAVALGGGATWFFGRTPRTAAPVAATRPTATASPAPTPSATTTGAASTTTLDSADVMTAPDSPRVAAAELLQALVDARALAYVSRNPALLDLVYAPGIAMVGVDQANIATALKNGATYLGLTFAVQDVAFLDAAATTSRITATIVTPAYETGQPDGRKVPHAQEIVGPSVFTLSLISDGWRILSLTAP